MPCLSTDLLIRNLREHIISKHRQCEEYLLDLGEVPFRLVPFSPANQKGDRITVVGTEGCCWDPPSHSPEMWSVKSYQLSASSQLPLTKQPRQSRPQASLKQPSSGDWRAEVAQNKSIRLVFTSSEVKTRTPGPHLQSRFTGHWYFSGDPDTQWQLWARAMTCQEITRSHTSTKRKLPTEASPKLCLVQVESQLDFDSVNHSVSLLHGTEKGACKHSSHYSNLQSRISPLLDSLLIMRNVAILENRGQEFYHNHHTYIFQT